MSATATDAADEQNGAMTPNEARERIDRPNEEAPGTWVSELEAHVWAMEPNRLSTLASLAASGQLHTSLSMEAEAEALRRGRPRNIQGGVQRIPLKGVLMPMSGLLALFFGDMDPLAEFRRGLREAVGDSEVGAIVIDVDSPGGVVDNIPEVAAELRAARGSKPIVASVNTLAASAAYWIAAQADEVSITPSGMAGSIGVYQMHRDMSGALAMMGVKTTFISAGKFKVEGNPFEPLTEEAREHIQEDVDYYYDLFVKDVAAGRGAKASAVRTGYGEGRVLTANRAVQEGLVDRVETTDQTVARLSSRSRGSVTRAFGAEDDSARIAAEADAGAAATVEQPEAEADAGADTGGEDEEHVYSREEKDRIFDAIAAGLYSN